jgi:hypothetical protein
MSRFQQGSLCDKHGDQFDWEFNQMQKELRKTGFAEIPVLRPEVQDDSKSKQERDQ